MTPRPDARVFLSHRPACAPALLGHRGRGATPLRSRPRSRGHAIHRSGPRDGRRIPRQDPQRIPRTLRHTHLSRALRGHRENEQRVHRVVLAPTRAGLPVRDPGRMDTLDRHRDRLPAQALGMGSRARDRGVTRALVRLSFDDPEVTALVAAALVTNRASTHVMEKLGMTRVSANSRSRGTPIHP